MATPLAIYNQTNKPLKASDAPKGEQALCWFCKQARVYRKTSVKGKAYYSTYKGDLHTHPVCASPSAKGKCIEFEDMRATFHKAMLRERGVGNGSTGEQGHLSPRDEEEIYLEKLTSLSGVVKWGLFECPNFQLNDKDVLSDVVINSIIAPDYFAGGADVNLGLRAIVARPDSFNKYRMWIRYALEYKSGPEEKMRTLYFYHTTTSREFFDTIKDKLFQISDDGNGYVPKENLSVIIYGDWKVCSCNTCKFQYGQTDCTGNFDCVQFLYSSYLQKNFVYAFKAKQ